MSIRDHLKDKPKKKLSKFEQFDQHFEELYELRKELYSYEELKEAFENKTRIELSYLTFRDYFNISRRNRGYNIVKIREVDDYVEV